ncbi:ABC transporter ATP-binding protein [Roseibium alexandrii]|uniref:ABC-type branched-chain amino acid transport system, ATPase component n=1 Tax=Roseibium alexandrii (strain DSM 17067 / NCIMB 14079 / DFL-11) TaxID=244592 RepID=A0A5E8GT98_ROSAD|nr:ABC transporter ATP-binding protein [Roseibium alexandrii]EEE43059.1 ABC-type branched-chain amino acid transport system, ATPase component [Roseibium alexandrii DFL-11]
MAVLALDNVSKSFGALKVSQHITFELFEGEALGVIGPNGAGKSTLFNLITGNIDVDDGQIEFLGRDVTRVPPMERCLSGLGRTFQIPQPFEKLTVFENLIVAGAFGNRLPESEVADQCADILVETGLIGKANELAGRLSLLERKRLELARAIATQPKVLLLDEIAGGLTEGECHALVATIQKIHTSGMSIIWIEHVLHALTSVAERLLVLDFGKVIGIGEPDAIMNSKEVREIYLGLEV